ncbi:Low-density lipoprotein receptor-related protein [Folsomia candida]|uniref:Low-density lipoprotein receptor-related protein n=1 Tax=Folsomia candida TaxID=158441 RepID=A0A226D906_FOLCA|nr:Low-density lipoprotein receptor-related protein [Folsomia candida]
MGFKQLTIYCLVVTTYLALAAVLVGCKWVGIHKPCLCQEFRCANGTSCLHKSRVCNGYKDCPGGGEDELGYADRSCFKRVVKCDPQTEFKCKFGGCIEIGKVCDGTIDCFGGVDEASDFCAWVHGEENSTAVNPYN